MFKRILDSFSCVLGWFLSLVFIHDLGKQSVQYDCKHGLNFSGNTEEKAGNWGWRKQTGGGKLGAKIGSLRSGRNKTWRDDEEVNFRNATKAFKESGEMVCTLLETDTAQHRLYLNGVCCRLRRGELEGILRCHLLHVHPLNVTDPFSQALMRIHGTH